MLGRHTELNEPDLDVGGGENFYMAALQQINVGAASSFGQAVTIPTSQRPTSSGKIEDAATEEARAGNVDEETCLTLCNLYLMLIPIPIDRYDSLFHLAVLFPFIKRLMYIQCAVYDM